MDKLFQRTVAYGFTARPGLLLRASWLLPLSLAASLPAFAQSSVGIADSELPQPSDTTAPMSFTVTRNGDTSADRLAVGFSTRDNTATAGEDYIATQSCVSFASGEVEKSFAVPILPGSSEQDIDFKVDLAQPAADHLLPPVRSNFKPPVDAISQKPNTNSTYNPFRNLESPDINGDGWSDLVGFASTWNSDFRAERLEVFAGTPGGTGGAFTYIDDYVNYHANASAVAFADWNNDGIQDMIVASGDTFHRIDPNNPPKGRIAISFGQRSFPDIFQPEGEVFGAPYTFGELQVDTSSFKYIDPNSIKVRDLDGDGDPDIVVDDQWDGFIHIYRNPRIDQTGGQQQGWISIDMFNPDAQSNFPVRFINVADLDGDGYPDIVLTGGDSTVTTLRTMRNTTASGSAPLTFGEPVAHAGLSNPSTTQRNHLIDVNCDGKPDVIFATGTGVAVALNTSSPGSISFGQAVVFAPGEAFPSVGAYRYASSQPLAILTSRSSDSSIGLHVNNSCPDGQPTSSIQFVEEARRATRSTQFGHRTSLVGTFYFGPRDNNNGLGDPFPDIVEGYKFFEDGTGFPKNSIAVHEFDPPRSENTTVLETLGNLRHFYPATLDYDGDGRMDLLKSPKRHGKLIFGRNITAQSGDLPIFEQKVSDSGGDLFSPPVVADFNLDGKPDLAIKSSRQIAVFLNETVTDIPKFTQLLLPEGTEDALTTDFRKLAVGDLDGDGRPDLLYTALLTGPIPAIRGFPNTTTPGASEATFGDELFYHFDDAMLGTPQDLASTDLNADGRDDLILVGDGSHKRIGVRLSIPGGTSTAPAYAEPVYFDLHTVGDTPSLSYFEIHTGDLNGDGRPDIALSYRNGQGSIFINETPMGAEQPVFRAEQRFGPASGQFAGGFDIADMNGDCLADIALSTAAADDVYLLINQGEDAGGVVQFSEVGPYASALSPHHLVTADFNNDGRRDFATSNRPTGRFYTNRMTIHATQFNAPSSTLDPLASTATGTIISAIDSDNDGMPDYWEIEHGLNPNDPSDAGLDEDNDGLSNLQEFQKGTDPNDADTDGDGITDGVDDQPLTASNACIEDGNGDALFEVTAPANMVTQCAASNAVSVTADAIIHVDAMLQLIAPRVGFSAGVSVPQGAVMRVWKEQPGTGEPM